MKLDFGSTHHVLGPIAIGEEVDLLVRRSSPGKSRCPRLLHKGASDDNISKH